MCLHAYFNIYLQAKNGWKTFINRRTAVKKINSLPEVKGAPLREIEDVCAICYQEFAASARITPCHHYFHALCLRKWLYIQDTCPMCHQHVYIEDDGHERIRDVMLFNFFCVRIKGLILCFFWNALDHVWLNDNECYCNRSIPRYDHYWSLV
uniref:E3 ubiquitin-protein ligase RNF139 n=1 Tax=Sinocyclocheilus rhinocerous TaxID=307959 RepID=A0A673HAU2_9TELE